MPPESLTASARTLEAAWQRAVGRHALFSTRDPHEARLSVGRVFRPHDLQPRSKGGSVAARMDYLPLGLLSLSRLRYGTPVDIRPGPLERFYLLQLPLSGCADIAAGDIRFASTSGLAALLSPEPGLSMRWDEQCDQLIVRIGRDELQRFCGSWVGDDAMQAPVFDPRLAVDGALIEWIASAIAFASHQESAGISYPLSLVQLHNHLLAALLSRQPHSARERLGRCSAPLAPRCVRLVEEYLMAHPQEAVTPQRLAELSGVSVRSLFSGFQRYRRIGPMKLLKEIRLRRVRDELLVAPAGTRVTDVALRWGFYHLGRFGQDYKAAFGELPSATLSQH